MEFNWKPFNDAYKKTPDKVAFYETGIQKLVSANDRLGLLTQTQLEATAPFKWDYAPKGPPLSQVLADFAQKNGSKKPTFDAMLWISHIVELCKRHNFTFDPDRPTNLSLSIEKGKLSLFKEGKALFPFTPLLEAEVLRATKDAGEEELKTESKRSLGELSEAVQGQYLGLALDSIYTQAETGEFPQDLDLFREFLIRESNLDSIYLGLQDAHKGRPENLSSYVEQFEALLQDVEKNRHLYPEQSNEDFENLNELISVLNEANAHYLRARVSEKEGSTSLFNPENDAFVDTNQEAIRETGSGLYELLGLDPSKIRRDPSVFLEMAMRRERNILDWKDEAQSASAKSGVYTDPTGSIGTLGIQPQTYLKALLLKHGIPYEDSYEVNRSKAKNRGLIDKESDIAYQLDDPAVAIDIFSWILKKEVSPKNEPIEIILNHGEGKKPYKLPLQETYTFATGLDANKKPVGSISFTHDEMRLLEALAKYQGDGLYLMSKDKEVPVEQDTILDTRQLVLNNRTTYCLAGLS